MDSFLQNLRVLITKEMIAETVGVCGEYTPDFSKGEKAKSPGVLYKHYSPKCETKLFTDILEAINFCDRTVKKGKRVAVLAETRMLIQFSDCDVILLDLGYTDKEMANRLYGLLREAEKVCDILVAVEPSEKDGAMAGVLNRFRKACTSTDIKH